MVGWLCAAAVAGWFDGAPRTTLGPDAKAAAARVPLMLEQGDPRPRVVVWISEELQVLATLDVANPTPRLGRDLARAAGIRTTHRPKEGEVATVPWLRVGDLVFHDARVRVVDGDGLVLATPDTLAVAILPSRGEVLFAPAVSADLLLAGVGPSQTMGATIPAVVEPGSHAVSLAVRTDIRTSRLAAAPPGMGVFRAGHLAVHADAHTEHVDLSAVWWRVDDRVAADGVIGADLLAGSDLVFDGATRRLALAPAVRPTWTDAPLSHPVSDACSVPEGPRFCAALTEGLVALRAGMPAAGPLRRALAQGGRNDPRVRVALLVAGEGDAVEGVIRLAALQDTAPLTTALAIARTVGPEALVAGIDTDPSWVAGRLVARALYGRADLRLGSDLRLEAIRHPGDPGARCRVSLLAVLEGEGVTEARLHPDCVVAQLLDPSATDDAKALAWGELQERWPFRMVPVDDPNPPAVRTIEPDHSGAPMIPFVVASALTAQAAEFDHTHAKLGAFLDQAVSTAGVDYSTLASRRATLDSYIEGVQSVDASGFDNAQKLALYVNAYNAYTLQTILDSGPPKSIMELDGGKVWDVRTFVVAGQTLTLNEMEHGNARKLADGRVHAAVNCASKGCPPLPPLPMTSTGQTAHLDGAARQWAATNAFTLDGDTIRLSKIFDWYADDFPAVADSDIPGVEGKAENALNFLARYVDEDTKTKLLSGSLTADWQDYDWSLNQR